MNQSPRSLLWSAEGSDTIEFAVSSVFFMFMAFVVVEYGVLFSSRTAVTSLAREGASLASRNITTNGNIMSMLASMDGTFGLKNHLKKYAIFLAQINGSVGLGQTPVCTVTTQGTLSHTDIHPPSPSSQCDLPNNLSDYLKWDTTLPAP